MKANFILSLLFLLLRVMICFFLCLYSWAYGGILGFALAFAICACWLGWASSGMLSALFGNLFYSDSEFVKTPPAYSRPEHMVARGQYLEALEEYNLIIAEYDNEARAFDAILEICLVHLDRPDLAKKFLERGLETLQTEAARQEIRRCYEFFLSKKEVSYSGAKEMKVTVDPSIVKEELDIEKVTKPATAKLIEEKPRAISLKKTD